MHAPSRRCRRASSRGTWRRLLVAALVAVLAVALATGCAATREAGEPALEDSPAVSAAPAGVPAESFPHAARVMPGTGSSEREWVCGHACRRWRPVLDDLDRSRARAYALGRPDLLHRVYLPRSQVLARDRRMLAAWTSRRATVSHVRLHVLHVQRMTPPTGGPVRLRVVDRLGPVTAHLAGGRTLTLPHDRPTARVLVLARAGQGWRIAASR